MGAYLSTPNTDKDSCDNVCKYFNYGASSMQGWRISQEDSLNCIPDFDVETNTSLFAVYDGHGGSEVAQFCSLRLPDFIKESTLYKEGKLGEALEASFLDFDQKLLEPEVLNELKVFAGLEVEEEEKVSKNKSLDKSEAQVLQDEANMPLEDLLAKYEGMVGIPQQRLLPKKRGTFNSPVIKSKKSANSESTDRSSTVNTNTSATPTSTSNMDLKPKDILANGHAENENNLNMEKEQIASRHNVDSESPVTSSDNIDNKIVQQSKICSSDTVSSTSAKSETADSHSNSSHNDNSVSNSANVKSSLDCDKDSANVSCSEQSLKSTASHVDGENCIGKELSSSNDPVSSTGSKNLSSSSSTVSSSSSSVGSVACNDSSSSKSLLTESSAGLSASSSSASSAECTNESAGVSSSASCSSSNSTVAETSSTYGSSSTLVGSSSSECEIQAGGSGSSAGGSDSSAGGSGSSAGGSGLSADGSGSSSGGSGLSPKGKKSALGTDEDDEYEEEILLDDEFDSDEEDDENVEYDSSEDDDDEEEEEEEDSTEEEEDFGPNPFSEQNAQNAEPGFDSGSTAVLALLRDKEVVVANVGDSRCIVSRAGKAIDLSFDHKPEDADERSRIEGAGGKVTADGRVNGGLNLSRAIGDHLYKNNKEKSAKEQMISALPDIQSTTLQEDDEFMVIACDGIWNYLSSQEVVDFVKEKLKLPENKERLSKICEELFDYCLAPNTAGDGTGCDNMTCVIIDFEKMFKNNHNKRTISDTDSNMEVEIPPEKRCKADKEEDIS